MGTSSKDSVARSLVELQPTAIIELFLLYFNTVDKPSQFIAIHGGTSFGDPIVWQGVKYLPMPIETDGFEVNGNGELPRPKIRISNKDFFFTDLLAQNQDFQFARLIRKRTFIKYLDDANFSGGNPWGAADSSAEIGHETFVISQKTAENKNIVEFELTSPLDLDNFDVNNRLIMARYCSWYYRGNGCNYNGCPIETEDGRPVVVNENTRNNWPTVEFENQWGAGITYNSGDAAYLDNMNITINPHPDAEYTYPYAKIWYVCQSGHTATEATQPDLAPSLWVKDGCTKKISSCKKRFQNSSLQQVVTGEAQQTNNYLNLAFNTGLFKSGDISGLMPTLTGMGSNMDVLHFATWVSFPSGIPTGVANNQVNAIFNNYAPWYAGGTNPTGACVNLFVTGSTTGTGHELRLQYTTHYINATARPAVNNMLSSPYNISEWQPIHVIFSGGKSTGTGVGAGTGYVELIGRNGVSLGKSGLRDTEWFDIKNRTYSLTGNNAQKLRFGVASHTTLGDVSPMRIGTTVIWTGDGSRIDERIRMFNSESYGGVVVPKQLSGIPPVYDPTDTLKSSGVVSWLDMNQTKLNADISVVTPSNGGSMGMYIYGTGTQESGVSYYDTYYTVPQTPRTFLPFGGFPATDKFGA